MTSLTAIADSEPRAGERAATRRSAIVVVVIGRNEGERLRRCFESLGPQIGAAVYVDSGSTDGSVVLAESMGVPVIELGHEAPFTAARARNAGLARALQHNLDTEFVQFVDGDCQLAGGWLESAEAALRANANVVAVFGRLHERHPDASIFNRLCEVEWNLAPVGVVQTCGGNCAIRIAALQAVGGFDASLPAGEEGELCVRLRQAGGTILRLDADMGWHDANITHWTQWWRRAERFGLASAEGAARHGKGPERFHVRDVVKAILTGGLLPLAILALAWPTNGWSLLAFLYYPLTALRVARHVESGTVPWSTALAFGASVALAKIPQFVGVCRWAVRTVLRRPVRLIEHK